MKKSWYSNRKVQCVFVILLLGAIGVIVWWALSRPSPAPELVLVSSSPSVSMYPSMSPTTGVPSSIPSLNPTGRQIKTVTVEIRFDRFPNEIGWRLEDACGILEEVQPGICQTDHSHVHVTREDDVTNGVSERSEVFEHVPGVPGQS